MDKKIIRKSFWPPIKGRFVKPELTEDELGWGKSERLDAGSDDTKAVFDMMIGRLNWDLSFYYTENDKFYYIEVLDKNVFCRIEKPDWDGKYDLDRIYTSPPPGDGSEIIMSFNDIHEVWENFKIDGKDMKYIIEHSVVWLST